MGKWWGAALAVGVMVVATPRVAATAPACSDWPMYGANPQRTFSAGCPSAITPQNAATLIPAWTFDTPRPVTASPTIADGTVYVGAWDGVMYALDARSGALRWKHQTPVAPAATFGPIVSSAAVSNGRVYFGAGPRVFALDARSGAVVWEHDSSRGIRDTPTEYESSPVVVGGRVLIGRDTHDEPANLTGGVRGGLVALDVATGKEVWAFEPELDRKGDGCGGMWSSPTLHPNGNIVYMGTANCPHDDFKWTPYTNAVTALDVATGKPLWSFQPTGKPDHDTDFGATPNFFVDRNGRAVLGAGKKDGTYYALDPLTGKELWRAHVQDPVEGVGGFIGSPAVYAGNVFGGTAIGKPPYFHSIDGATGAVRFRGGVGPSYGASAAVNGVVFNAALDDLLKAYDAATGRLLWAGALSGPGSSGPAVAGDMVFVGAGTSTSDLCAKDNPTDPACRFFFDTALATLGGVHAFRLLLPSPAAAPDSPTTTQPTTTQPAAAAPRAVPEQLPRTGGADAAAGGALVALALAARFWARQFTKRSHS